MTNNKKINVKTTLLFFVGLLILYFFFSILTNEGSFVIRQDIHSASKDNSKERELLIDKKLNISYAGDSVLKYRDSFEIWLDKSVMVTQYGMFPLHYTSSYDSTYVLNIRPKIDFDNWCVRFDNQDDLLAFAHNQFYTVDKAIDTVTIKFYHCMADGINQIGTIKVSLK